MTSDVWPLAFLRLGSLALIPEQEDLETGVLDKKKVENLLHSDTRYNSVFPHLNPVLVQRKPGNKPRGLKENVFSYWMTYLLNLPKCQVPTWRRKMRAMQMAALTQKAWSMVMIVKAVL